MRAGTPRSVLIAVNGWIADRSDFVTPFHSLSRRDGAPHVHNHMYQHLIRSLSLPTIRSGPVVTTGLTVSLLLH
jgi:hypothetical protein